MDQVRILLVNEPRSYRETLAAALRQERPSARILATPAERFGGELRSFRPDLVVSSRLADCLASGADWVLLYPDGRPTGEVGIGLVRTQIRDVDFDTLLEQVDRLQQEGVGA